ncbi:MAG: hypothetical protein ABS913_07945 [Desemzia incerta]
MLDKYKEFTEKHPYKHVMILMAASSFIGTALYGAIGLTLIELLRTKRR